MSELDRPQAWLRTLHQGEPLSPLEAERLAASLLDEDWPGSLVGALLSALATRGESAEEITAFAKVLRERAEPFPGPRAAGAVDLCGTGGAPRPTFNISTTAAFVVAGAGVPVAKHGNASARGPCGSSDLLEALGLPTKTSRAFAHASWQRARICFLHAPLWHPTTRRIAPVRRALGARTIFNLLGPLTNPAAVRYHLVGSPSKAYARRAAPAFLEMGVERVWFVHGARGADEFVPDGRAWTLRAPVPPTGSTEEVPLDPRPLLAPRERRGDLGPRAPAEAAQLARRILEGTEEGGPRGAVLLTAGAAMTVQGKSRDLPEGVELARESIRSGAARAALEELLELGRSQRWAEEGHAP